jgi:crotonobetainyl-CoA:carnitine CoA-transferase CaiB-like acyl-CoA transferase
MLALKGLKVLDLTRLTPGNFCSMILGDLGADVLKVEEPGRGDYMRWTEPLKNKQSIFFTIYNRNKRSLTLNLKVPTGLHILKKLIQEYDIILEGFRPGVAKRLGIDYDSLTQINKRLIYCSISGYGQGGPYRDRPGHDLNYLAVAGLLHLIGLNPASPPVPPGIPLGDLTAALYAVIGILAAAIYRLQTGYGQFIDIAMLDGIISLLGLEAPKLFVTGENVERGSTFAGGAAANSVFITKDDKYITLVIFEDKHWHNFCRAIDRQDLIEMNFREKKQGSQLHLILQEIFKKKNIEEWIEIFNGVDTCFEPILDFQQALNHPQIIYRQMVFETEHPTEGSIKQLGFPIKFSRTPSKHFHHSPGLGEHTADILRDLGFTAKDVQKFRDEGIV